MSMDLDLGSGSGISGPTYLNRSCMMMMNNVAGCSGGVGEPVDVRRKEQQQQKQPFDWYNTSSTCSSSVSKSPGGMSMASAGAASMGFFPFTNAQWKELERQAMVFKYMMHSIPVPYELLFPFITATNLSDPSGMRRDTHVLKFLKNGDPEPGRCRRTDGKKWRCSNAVALDQKYCEKHVHRGRPRSRKHVEAASDLNNIHKKPCLVQNHNQTNTTTTSLNHAQIPRSTDGYTNAAFQLASSNKTSVASLFPQSHLRNGDLSVEQWHQLMQFQQHQQSSIDSYAQTKQDPQEFNLFLNPDLKKPTSSLIDAWTLPGNNNTSNTHHDLVSLGLSMGHGYNEEDDINHRENKQEQTHTNNWLLTHSGGPLGEVLRPPATPSPTTATGAGDSTTNNKMLLHMSSSSSPPSTTGVLQEAAASLSDGTRHST